jgi:predicted permease
MRFYHIEDECDELRCPRCGMVIKKAGVPLRGQHFSSRQENQCWFSDFAYYIFVPFIVNRQNRYINPNQREISIILGASMVLIGIYFLILVLQQLML